MKMKFEETIKINLPEEIFYKMVKCVKKANPNEACGLVFGTIEEVEVDGVSQFHYNGKKFNCFESDSKSPVAFLIEDFEELYKVMATAKDYGLRVVSIFHSHPSGAYPSGVDRNHMEYLDEIVITTFKNQIWTIMDATNENLNGFIYYQKKLRQVDVQIWND